MGFRVWGLGAGGLGVDLDTLRAGEERGVVSVLRGAPRRDRHGGGRGTAHALPTQLFALLHLIYVWQYLFHRSAIQVFDL